MTRRPNLAASDVCKLVTVFEIYEGFCAHIKVGWDCIDYIWILARFLHYSMWAVDNHMFSRGLFHMAIVELDEVSVGNECVA